MTALVPVWTPEDYAVTLLASAGHEAVPTGADMQQMMLLKRTLDGIPAAARTPRGRHRRTKLSCRQTDFVSGRTWWMNW